MRFFTSSLFALSFLAAAQAVNVEDITRRTFGSTTEYCGCFSGSVSVASFFGIGSKSCGSVSSRTCLCESQIVDWLYSSSSGQVGKNILSLGGYVNGRSTISDLLRRDSSSKQCTIPVNGKSKCSSSNVCDFECVNGFTKSGSSCVCPSNKNLCGNGQCQSQACPSGVASLPHKRDLSYWGKQTQKVCKQGWKACGIPGGGPRDWECVNVRSDLESCGGCTMDLLSSTTGRGLGVDCTLIPGVSDVSCNAGACAVNKCMPGYKVSSNGKHCEREENVMEDTLRVGDDVYSSL